ncbi:hypothetical protein Z517_11240 [Fonsecaea pedrosoi CBS 271.37]|uniref:Heterokaryon incompatibility domain-containing protein n=1 Tax=Fonsecaea pedrosoi CBS 271.37 TaxID=1442368 RepID=A0A0D2GVY5_9EURO|nr:uncharacterized protein Z517_11240 [Fonsecaea pedrosoi CBS 271.37]KIW76494.1 hypothetical protein Z517_11240 [Fonsecaea pedrosoi CBS 271.37]
MVCKVCHDMLYGHKGRRDSGSQLALSFWHHETAENVKAAAEDAECYLCRVIDEKLRDLHINPPVGLERSWFLCALLQRFPRYNGVYRLDIKLEQTKTTVASFVLKQNDANMPSHLQTTPRSANTSDPEVFDLARDWIDVCARTHAKCQTASSIQWYPTRLIDLRAMPEAETDIVRLVSQKDTEKKDGQPLFEGRYVTLSHRWGHMTIPKLRHMNRADLQTAILLEHLPTTFQHAMQFARELGVRWIWIDALCIIQGDEQDWLHESSQMDKVYAFSHCNISATAAIDGSEGLFNRRDPDRKWFDTVSLRTQDLSGDGQKVVECTISDLSFWDQYVDNAPVNRRSWVFQERLLAPRVLHWCKDQIAFECRELDRAECRPEGLPHLQMKAGQLVDQARLKAMDREVGRRLRELRLASLHSSSRTKGLKWMVEAIEPKLYLYEVWKRMVEVYTKMELSDERDRLIALSGIARMMTRILRLDGSEDQYLAGMWQNYLASQLLWYVNDGEEEGKTAQPLPDTRPRQYRAPTFSWASVETSRGVTFPETTDKGILVEVQVVRLTYRTEDDMFGILTDGYLVLKGVLRRIELTDAEQDQSSLTSIRKSMASCRPATFPWQWYTPSTALLAVTVVSISILLTMVTRRTLSWQQHKLILTLLFASSLLSPVHFVTMGFHARKQRPAEPEYPRNRFSWRLMQKGQPIGDSQSIVYLDSPASEPSVFGPNAQVFCLPVSQDDRHLNCLLIQATDGDHGIRYKRVGLTKIMNLFDQDVEAIKEPPTRKKDKALGRYYWGPNTRFRGESHICII